MKRPGRGRGRQRGVSLIEVLITLFVLLVGLLGVAALSLASQRASMESLQRHQALMLLDDMVSRMNANRAVADCYAISAVDTGTPAFGIGSGSLPVCGAGSIEAYTRANADLMEWDALLKGATVANADNADVGAMIGARGCISRLADGQYLVSVAWQGLNATAAPPDGLNCGIDLYGEEALRRAVAVPVQFADLGAS